MRRTILLLLLCAAINLSLAACSLPSSTPDAAATLRAVYTAQVITPQPSSPEEGKSTNAPAPPTLAFPTLSTATPTPAVLTATATPSLTPILYTSTPTVYCDWADFISDVTYPDGAVVEPSTQFTKIWRLKNIGTCTWTTAYALAFVNGDNMNGGASVNLPVNVPPGQTVDVAVLLSSPAKLAEYKGFWALRNAAGQVFGVGSRAADPFWVDIQVTGTMSTIYDFSDHYCAASWSSGAGDLGCPGDLNSNDGNVNKILNPKLETGQIFEGLALLTVPENKKNGYIQGLYPAFAVLSGDRFRVGVNCAYQSTGCNVIFQLNYQLNGEEDNLWQYTEVYDGRYDTMDIDLGSLAGKTVRFILEVKSNGSPKNDQPIWVNPRIERLDSLITPTVTPSVTPTVTPTRSRTPKPLIMP